MTDDQIEREKRVCLERGLRYCVNKQHTRVDCYNPNDNEVCAESECPMWAPLRCAPSDYYIQKCYARRQRCDGVYDCPYRNDEDGCNEDRTECPYNRQMLCSDGMCLSMDYRCDGFQNCYKGEDEHNCQNYIPCDDSKTPCDDYSKCFDYKEECNLELYCDDGTDEQGCTFDYHTGRFLVYGLPPLVAVSLIIIIICILCCVLRKKSCCKESSRDNSDVVRRAARARMVLDPDTGLPITTISSPMTEVDVVDGNLLGPRSAIEERAYWRYLQQHGQPHSQPTTPILRHSPNPSPRQPSPRSRQPTAPTEPTAPAAPPTVFVDPGDRPEVAVDPPAYTDALLYPSGRVRPAIPESQIEQEQPPAYDTVAHIRSGTTVPAETTFPINEPPTEISISVPNVSEPQSLPPAYSEAASSINREPEYHEPERCHAESEGGEHYELPVRNVGRSGVVLSLDDEETEEVFI